MTWLRMLAGSCAVYVVMAACSGDEVSSSVTVETDASSGGAEPVHRSDSSPVVEASVAKDVGFFDQFVSPVSDAAAQDDAGPESTSIVTLPCDVSHEGASWAVLGVPGRSAESLAGVRVLAELVASEVPPAPFEATHAPITYKSWVVVGDGKVGAQCGCAGCEPVYSSVTFFVP